MITAFFLGKFQIAENDHTMTEQSIRSEMLMKLLVYLIMHRDHSLTIQELTSALWENDEIDNPTGALKNLMYRLRMQFKETFGDDSYIVTGRGTYGWNPEIQTIVDAELFEDYSKKALDSNLPEELKKEYLEKAIETYKGEFGIKGKNVYWMMTQSTYYQSLYLSDILAFSEILIQEENYRKLEKVCCEAFSHDVTDENIHCYYVKSLILQNKIELASAHLEEAEHILQETLGIRNSKPLDKMKRELLRMKKGNLMSIREVLSEAIIEEDHRGAFQCSFSVFKEIYRLEARRIERFGMDEQLGMITIANTYQEQFEQFFMKQSMDRLENIIRYSLRAGDVFTRINDIQIIMLLPACSLEAAEQVLKRICTQFEQQFPHKGIEYKMDVRKVETYHPKKKNE